MFRNLTLNSIIWIALGIFCLAIGAYLGFSYRRAIRFMFPLPTGLTLTGFVMILAGLTNGFTDHSPISRKLTKAAVLIAIPGLLLLGYGLWRFPFN